MAKVSKFQRDVVIRCNHGITDGPADYVSRYRFDASGETWVAADAGGSERTDIGGPEDDGWFQPKKRTDAPRHWQEKIRCRACGKELSINAEHLQNVLGMVAPSDAIVTIAGLQKIIAHSQSSAKRRL